MKKSSRILKYDKNLTFKEFCNIESIKYWRQQLNSANTKNIQNESQLGGTKNVYTYGLLKFHNWLVNRPFQYTTLIPIDMNVLKYKNINIQLKGIDHLLSLSMNMYYKTDFTRLIKNYLAEISLTQKYSIIKNAIYSIRSFFHEHEINIDFHFKYKINNNRIPLIPFSLDDLRKILTITNIQPIEKAIFMCKFQRGLDNSTFVDRFNFEVWKQLIQHFKSDDPLSWDITKTPIPIHLARVKTGFMHTGFLDRDAIVSLVDYLKIRKNIPKINEALFIDRRNKPITTNWMSRRFHKLVIRSKLSNEYEYTYIKKYTLHEMRHLLKSTLIDSRCRVDVADHIIGHVPKDSYEKQMILYPESIALEFSKASSRINIFTTSFKNKSDKIQTTSKKIIQQSRSDKITQIQNSIKSIQSDIKSQKKQIIHIEKICKNLQSK